jgi:hypothetical protein
LDKIHGKNRHGLKAFDGNWVRSKSAFFWQTERLLQVFSTGTEKKGFEEDLIK